MCTSCGQGLQVSFPAQSGTEKWWPLQFVLITQVLFGCVDMKKFLRYKNITTEQEMGQVTCFEKKKVRVSDPDE